MKKLGKLSINPEKVMKNEELVSLRGGSYGDPGGCSACSGGMVVVCYTLQGTFYHCGWQGRDCNDECASIVPGGSSWVCEHQFCF